MAKQVKNTICLWYDGGAEDAARFYAETFPDSYVGAVHRAPADFPPGKKGDVLTVEFAVMGIPCLGLNGGPGRQREPAPSPRSARDSAALPLGRFLLRGFLADARCGSRLRDGHAYPGAGTRPLLRNGPVIRDAGIE